jgi:hypothetical protein
MPIFPRYGGISTDIAYDKAVAAPSDPAPKQVEALGQSIERAGLAYHSVAQKRQELKDEAETQKRYMQAVTDMEGMTEELNVPVHAMQAKDLFGKFLGEREPTWFEGLNSKQQELLQKKLFAKRLEYTVGSAKLQNRAELEDYSATLVKTQTWYANQAARRVEGDDGSKTPEYIQLEDMVRKGVAVGYIKPDKGEEILDGALKQGAYARVYRATASNSKEEIERVLELYKESESAVRTGEEDAKDPTFLKHIAPKERIELKKQLQGRLESLKAEDRRIIREEREDTKRLHDEQSKVTYTLASQKLADPGKYGTLTREWLDQQASLRLLDGKEYTYLRAKVEDIARSGTPQTGGFGNAEVIGRFSVEVFDTSTPEQASRVKANLKAAIARGDVPIGPGSIGSQWLNHLEEKTKAGTAGNQPPTMQQQTDDLKAAVSRDLRISGPMAKISDAERTVISEANEAFDRNAAAGYKRDPWDIWNENIDKWRWRVGQPGAYKSSELRRSLGMPPRQRGEKLLENGLSQVLENKRIELQDRMKATPPGVAGDAERSQILAEVRQLNRLGALESVAVDIDENVDTAKRARNEQRANRPPSPRRGR